MKTAIMFSGQGSQYANMGLDVLSKDKDKVLLANEILGFDVIAALKNENEELSNTKYTQPLMVLVSILLFDSFREKNDYDFLLGFSLGEYSALYAAGIYSFSDILKIVKYRSEIMEEAASKNPGKMAAVINFDYEILNGIVNDINNNEDKIVTIANYNSKKQLVISGNNLGVDLTIEKLKELGARRVIPLNVSGGFHSILMKDASNLLYDYLKGFNKNPNQKPLYLNTTANALVFDDLEKELKRQMYQSVKFYQTIENLINEGVLRFIEIGPGKVLKNLVQKNYDNLEVLNIENINDLKSLEDK